MKDNVVHIGVIGVGAMGRRHAVNLTRRVPNATVVAVMDADEARATAVAEECGGGRVFADARELIASPEVEAVVIASPDATHAPLTLACIDAGKPILCEKPPAVDAADARRVFQAEIAGGRRLVQAGFMREYDPAHRRVKATIDAGEIGSPILFRGCHYNLTGGSARSADDLIANSAVHDIHSAHWLMDREIATVYVQTVPAEPQQPASARLMLIQMSFRGGGLGIIQYNADSGYGYEVYVEITGESGQATSASLSAPQVRRAGQLSQAVESSWRDRFDDAYVNEATSWVNGIAADTFEGPTAWDGYTSLVVADACIRSIATGQPEDVVLDQKPAFYQAK